MPPTQSDDCAFWLPNFSGVRVVTVAATLVSISVISPGAPVTTTPSNDTPQATMRMPVVDGVAICKTVLSAVPVATSVRAWLVFGMAWYRLMVSS